MNDHPPVNCDDSNLCTVDSCNPATGCAGTPKVCQDGALCTVDTCDPLTGACAFPPVACPTGQTCNTGNGSCENSTPPCPCTTLPRFNADLAGITVCAEEIPNQIYFQRDFSLGSSFVFYVGSSSSCGLTGLGQPFVSFPLTQEQGAFCLQLFRDAAASRGVMCPEPP